MFKKQGFILILSLLLVLGLLPCSAFGSVKSTAKVKAPSALKGFSAYSSDKDNIYLHWQLRSEGDGVLIYRSSSASGTYKQIGKVRLSRGEFTDSRVELGKTYYYKARPYKLYKGNMIRGKYTAVKKKQAFHDNPCVRETEYLTEGKMTCEPVFKLTLDEYSYDMELSLDRGETWLPENSLLLDEEEGWGYSCLTMIERDTVGILYEGSTSQIIFQAIPLKDILKRL